MTSTLFTGGRLLDPSRDELLDGFQVLVEDDRVREVSDRPIRAAGAARIDLAGKTVTPGLIDCHVHVVAALVDLAANAMAPSSLAAIETDILYETGAVINALPFRAGAYRDRTGLMHELRREGHDL